MMKNIFKRKATDELENPTKRLKPTYISQSPARNVLQDKNEKNDKNKKQYSITCSFVGDKSTGKSNLLQQLGEKENFSLADGIGQKNGLFEKYHAQLTTRYGNIIEVTDSEAESKEELSRFRTLTYRMTDIFFICFSTVDRYSFDNVRLDWFAEIDHISPDYPIYLIGTKCDLRDSYLENNESDLVVSTEEGRNLKDEIGAIEYIETDICNRENFIKIIKEIGEVMLRQVENEELQKLTKQSYALPFARSKKDDLMSPRENHLKSMNKSQKKKKESIAVLSSKQEKVNNYSLNIDYSSPKFGNACSMLKENKVNAVEAPVQTETTPIMKKTFGKGLFLKQLKKSLFNKQIKNSNTKNIEKQDTNADPSSHIEIAPVNVIRFKDLIFDDNEEDDEDYSESEIDESEEDEEISDLSFSDNEDK